MRGTGSPRVVVLGILTKIPVSGVVWQTAHYLAGFSRLGCDTYYVEAHSRTPSMFMRRSSDDAWSRAARYLSGTMHRFGFDGRWAYHAVDVGRHFGMDASTLRGLYDSADLLVNLHGGTLPLEEHARTDRLVYVETDPVRVQVELHRGRQETRDFLDRHVAYFTFAENYYRSDCRLPAFDEYPFRPTRQPVVLSFWDHQEPRSRGFTTVANWKQTSRDLDFDRDLFFWSKDREFLKFIDIPERVGGSAEFELALSQCSGADRRQLARRGWRVRTATPLSGNLERYRKYIASSWGEFTVAKDQNVRLRTGWFSDRSATYLAAARPVIMQETGFSNSLPTGEGLFAFSNVDEAARSVERVIADYAHHSEVAKEIAHEYFGHDVVLRDLLSHIGLATRGKVRRAASRTSSVLGATAPAALAGAVLVPESRKPLRLPKDTERAIRDLPLDGWRTSPLAAKRHSPDPSVSIIVPCFDHLVMTKLALASVLAHTDGPAYEIIAVDDASSDRTPIFLERLARTTEVLRFLRNEVNIGFPKSVNRGLSMARGAIVVILNNDTVVSPHWLHRLIRPLEQESAVGMSVPTTNRSGDAAEINTTYITYGEMVRFAEDRARAHNEEVTEVSGATLMCAALPRRLLSEFGGLDERFDVGLFEDDDLVMRLRATGRSIVCTEDAFVHHFGQGTFGDLVPTGRYAELFEDNRRRFEAKWRVPWQGHQRRYIPAHAATIARIRAASRRHIPPGASVLVMSRGEEALTVLDGLEAEHFPRAPGGGFAGHYPATGEQAVRELESVRRSLQAEYLVIPWFATWWLDYYRGFADHLQEVGEYVYQEGDVCMIVRLRPALESGSVA